MTASTTVTRPLSNRAETLGLASMIDRHTMAIRFAITADPVDESKLQCALADLIQCAHAIEITIVVGGMEPESVA